MFSGSQKQKLEEVFDGLNVWLAAENGIYLRPPRSKVGARAGAWRSQSSWVSAWLAL